MTLLIALLIALPTNACLLPMLQAQDVAEVRLCTQVARAEIAIGGKPALSLEFAKARTPYPFILSLPQGSTERLMIAWLEARAIAVEWNVAVTGIGATLAAQIRDTSIKLYSEAAQHAAKCGIIIADTKFEFFKWFDTLEDFFF